MRGRVLKLHCYFKGSSGLSQLAFLLRFLLPWSLCAQHARALIGIFCVLAFATTYNMLCFAG